MVFPGVIYGCECWIIKKAEWWRIYSFEPWHWRRLLRVPWTARRSNQSILKEISPEYSLEGLMWKLKLQHFGHLMAKNWLTGKDPDAGKHWRQEEKGTIEDEMVGWHHQLDVHDFEQAPGIGDGQGTLACCSPWGCTESDMTVRLNWLICWIIILGTVYKKEGDKMHIVNVRNVCLRSWCLIVWVRFFSSQKMIWLFLKKAIEKVSLRELSSFVVSLIHCVCSS